MKLPLLALLIFVSTTVYAQTNREVMLKVKPSDLVSAFIGNCLQNVGQLDKIESFAKALNFQQVEGDAANMLGPQNQKAEYKLWIANQGQRAWSLNSTNLTHQLTLLLTDAKPSGADGVTLALSAIALKAELQH